MAIGGEVNVIDGVQTKQAGRNRASSRVTTLLASFNRKQPQGKNERISGPKKADKKALQSALVLRSMTFGATSSEVTPPNKSQRSALKQLKTDLLNPHLGNNIIIQLHALPAPSGPAANQSQALQPVPALRDGEIASTAVYPIHAVSLDCSDEDAERAISRQLRPVSTRGNEITTASAQTESMAISSVAFTDAGQLLSLFNNVKIRHLLDTPDFGFAQPIDGDGLLAGSIPSPDAVTSGLQQITRQLMALGYASSNAVFPNHSGVYPPLDRMSVITYWWGLELVLPEPSVQYLSKVTSIEHAVLNFLTAVGYVNNGVREILPFIRYISQFVDFEWTAIKAQDKGKGVVCASTWVMPVAMIPRPWDFPPHPPPKQPTSSPISKITPEGK